jgi:hypothetical protein
MLYASGKYLFLVQSLLGNELEAGRNESPSSSDSRESDVGAGQSRVIVERLAWCVRMIGHADLRWHLWIVLAVLGRLDLALIVYSGYFAARALVGAVRKGVQYA